MPDHPELKTEVAEPDKLGDLPVLVAPLTEEMLQEGSDLNKHIHPALERAGSDVKAEKDNIVLVHQGNEQVKRVLFVGLGSVEELSAERCRQAAGKVAEKLKGMESDQAAILLPHHLTNYAQAWVEGFWLGSYVYRRYKTGDAPQAVFRLIVTSEGALDAEGVQRGRSLAQSVYTARDLVNRSPDEKTAVAFAELVQESAEQIGFSVDVWQKDRIEKEGFGGLLAVNRGSEDPPTFSVLSWKPENARNEQPIVLVGKGVMYDTGGLSLKDTKGSMDLMKSDMAGAATVVGIFEALARLEVPLNVIGLIPATDNRPGRKAYVPGDVVRMHSGKTVEVMNTDAEGRLLLADALSYAKQFSPSHVVDFATLTGAAIIALGHEAGALMTNQSDDDKLLGQLYAAADTTGESIHPLPMYDAYSSLLRSEVADITNVGERAAGCITAGKFLEHFVDYPWVHLDIAGTAFIQEAKPYQPVGGTGFGVRLVTEALSHLEN